MRYLRRFILISLCLASGSVAAAGLCKDGHSAWVKVEEIKSGARATIK